MKKAPGTSGLMPVKGSGCGIRPDTEKMEDSEGFDFSAAASLREEALQENNDEPTEKQRATKTPPQHEPERARVQRPASDSEDQSSPEPQE